MVGCCDRSNKEEEDEVQAFFYILCLKHSRG